ncbi:MAG: VOC family protein [Bacteroidales bacterium]
MRFEHFGINVPDPVAMAAWYVKHLKMKVVRSMNTEPFTHFLGDEQGRVCMEVYANKLVEIPDYNKLHPLQFHCAFEVTDPQKLSELLIADGAKFCEEVRPDEKSLLIMLRDPWGIPLQLCKRSVPML